MSKVLAMILAGGAGTRLEPLTRERAKPAVPFGGRYRIIDFALSNFTNSGVYRVKVLTQYKSDSLNNHLSRAWRMSAFLGHYVEAVPAQMRTGVDWYKGSADAIYQNLNIITDEEPDFIFVFGADHVYRMDTRQMLDFHVSKRAACTVAAIPVPIEQGREFGIIDVGPDGRMRQFLEKPKDPPPMPGNPKMCLASMGNYLFTTEVLVQEVVRDAANEASAHDFGKSIISELYKYAPVYVYDFATNEIAGQEPKERGYWRDVGNIDVYYQSNMELVEVDPIFNLYNDRWPIHTQANNYPPAKFVFADQDNQRVGHATDSLIAEGCIISGGKVNRSVLSPKVRVNSYSEVEASILFENVTIGRRSRIRKAIIDKNVEIPPGTTIGYDPVEDKRRFHVTPDGVVVIPKGMKVT
ncbi:glucose-1-phosphate adenylyltransferase [Myxococcus faecalis]|jgi:glucose-1-phosphate adenylyltransferase|uniref:glucose-1-phosphate adenylyltransferase n=1 Tax=Myxococcus TaxID=32 RepID=UPI001CC02DAE|nr:MULTISPECIES: glucose-1-phosphate adenylyltransferase [unclassified Myxococcus]MBZ4399660.1 glucose-1-phosphate adenylyltransferase [Myxococcus sp. AS-1-15]MBZ4409724.1 glucose-1-phosphate adenylyltransferase [Myxococcus sp. XM-1-1-1]BDT32137.1 glucose-1-phosphate adenylyltransferase [Myxococcus sp. MH1]